MEYGLIGEHLPHSFSKEIHGRCADYDYRLTELAPDEIDGFLKAKKFKAINVTIPYKQTVIPYLDEIDASAQEIGAVNTMLYRNFDKPYCEETAVFWYKRFGGEEQ